MEEKFEILDHTADLRIRVWGESRKALIENSVHAMLSLIIDLKRVRHLFQKKIRIEGESAEELLLQCLREVLFLMERYSMVFNRFQIEKDNFASQGPITYFFEGLLRGEKLNSIRHEICTEIKAVTRHGLSVKKERAWWEANILFDV